MPLKPCSPLFSHGQGFTVFWHFIFHRLHLMQSQVMRRFLLLTQYAPHTGSSYFIPLNSLFPDGILWICSVLRGSSANPSERSFLERRADFLATDSRQRPGVRHAPGLLYFSFFSASVLYLLYLSA